MKPYHKNPRTLSKKRAARLRDTLARLGDLSGIVHNIPTDEVIGGNQRTFVFKNGKADIREAEIEIVEEYDQPDEQGTLAHGFIIWQGKKYAYRRVIWDAETCAEANVAANLGAGQWDFDILADQFNTPDLIEWGFDDDLLKDTGTLYGALENILASEEDEPPADPGPQIDKAEELREKWQTETGQLWIIPSKTGDGEHRIICGDCTDAEVVARVMGGEKAEVYNTDPPYGENAGNIGFTAQRDDIEAITKDDLSGVEMQSFLESVFRVAIPHLEIDCAWYLWHPMLTQGYFTAAAAAADLIIHRQIIWAKEQFIFGRGDYHWRHELCFYGWRKGNRPAFYGERNQDTIWYADWGEKRSSVGHPTAKPPKLFEIPINNHTSKGDVCLDTFLGSGSQVIACERLARQCRGVEISPAYVAVSLQRLADMGLEPYLMEDDNG